MNDTPVRLAIVMRGGALQSAFCDSVPVHLAVVDYDLDRTQRQARDDKGFAYNFSLEPVQIDPDRVTARFKEMGIAAPQVATGSPPEVQRVQVALVMRGGVIQAALSDSKPVLLSVVDYDADHSLALVRDAQGHVHNRFLETVHINPALVQQRINEIHQAQSPRHNVDGHEVEQEEEGMLI